jgi:ribosome biogenesis GTPase / thiamine phosphate phosphatase
VFEGLVIKVAGNIYTVKKHDGNDIDCRIRGNLREKGLRSTNPVTVGDKVHYSIGLNDSYGTISKIEDRKNYIIRKSTNLSKLYQIIAANVDQAILIVTLTEPVTNTDFIDRYLVATESFRIKTIIVFNKYDLYKGEILKDYKELLNTYSSIGYDCFATSIKTEMNISKLEEILQNKISVINGNSGVGKSSIIKSISPKINLKIGDISEYHKAGIHTTSYSEMYELNKNTYIIDTPGIRGFGLIDFYKDELYHYFPEIFKVSSICRFYNCTHTHEPGCQVIESVKDNTIALSRYTSYLNIFNDEGKKYRY